MTDQQTVSYMFNSSKMGKIKNNKCSCGTLNKEILTTNKSIDLELKILPLTHFQDYALCLPILLIFVIFIFNYNIQVLLVFHILFDQRIFPFHLKTLKENLQAVGFVLNLKSHFYTKPTENLIKLMCPWERISIDFKGPLQSERPYVLFVVDEFSQFQFAFPCNNIKNGNCN